MLLSPSLQPQAASQFEAVLVLLGGHWPARGLLSGGGPGLVLALAVQGNAAHTLRPCGGWCRPASADLPTAHVSLPTAPLCYLVAGQYPPEGEADQPDPALGADLRPCSSLGALGTSPSGTASDGGGSFGGRAQSLGRVRRRHAVAAAL